jgi:hypothetical protein
VLAEAAGQSAELEVLIVRHHAGGWVSEIARKDEDALIEAHFDHESGVVTVYEGRPEFEALEHAARRAARGIQARARARVPPLPPARSGGRRQRGLPLGGDGDRQPPARHRASQLPVEYAQALRHETQSLRHRTHERLMRAFLDPEVFTGGVRVLDDEPSDARARLSV